MVPEASLKQIVVQEKEAGMYAIYCHEKKYEERIVKLLEQKFDDVRVCARWEKFLEASRAAVCSIVEVEDLSVADVHQQLLTFCIHSMLRPLVLLTSGSRENARELTKLCADEVVWLQGADEDLVRAVNEAEGPSLLAVLSDALEKRSDLPPQLKSAILQACRAPKPIKSQLELAELACCDRRTLIRQWNDVFKDEDATLKTLLDWIVLIRCFQLKELGSTWKQVATNLGVSHRTIVRIATRCTDKTVGQLDLHQVESGFSSATVYRILIQTIVSV